MKFSRLTGLVIVLGLFQIYDQKDLLGHERCPTERKLKQNKPKRRLQIVKVSSSQQVPVPMRRQQWHQNRQQHASSNYKTQGQGQVQGRNAPAAGQQSSGQSQPNSEPVYRQSQCSELELVGNPLNFLPAIESLARSITRGTKSGKTRLVFLGKQNGKSTKVYAIFQTLIKTGSSFMGIKVSITPPKSVTLIKMVYALEPISVMIDLGMRPIRLEPLSCPPIEELPPAVVIRDKIEPGRLNEKGELVGRYSGDHIDVPVTVTKNAAKRRRLARKWSFK